VAQNAAQFCPQCGTLIQAGQRFCSNCGTTLGINASAPTAAASYVPTAPNQAGGFGITGPTVPETDVSSSSPPITGQDPYRGSTQAVPPPPPAPTYNPYDGSAPGGAQTYEQNASITPGYIPPPAGGTYAPVPAYAQAPRRSHGCLITSIILLLVLAAGIGGFIFVNRQLNKNNGNNPNTSAPSSGTTNNGSSNGGNSGASTGGSSSSNVASSEQLNIKITYASLNLTLVSAQLASRFNDDTSSPGQTGVVRINLREDNTTASNPDYLESDAMHLLLPDGSSVQSNNAQQDISPAAGVSRQNWIDFPVNTQITLNRLTLRIGTPTENQMDIPLQPNANVSKYQNKTSSPNAQFQYAGVNWTLKTATLSYSYNDRQATSGNLYVILAFDAKNNTSNGFLDYPGSFMRLQAGANTAQPESATTMPDQIAASSTASGIVAFLMPQGTTSFTLIMLAQPNNSPPISQVTQAFQIQ